MGRRFANGHKYDNFEPEEFHCPCCGVEKMAHSTMSKLEDLRHDYGKRISIMEGGGWRCGNYDNSNSAHKEGRAVDPSYPREDHFILLKLAFYYGFTGIGDKYNDGEYQQHWDDAGVIHGVRPRPRKWTYNSSPD